MSEYDRMKAFKDAKMAKDKEMIARPWRDCASELYDALCRVVLECDNLDHRKIEQHDLGDECPVLAKIEAAKTRFDYLNHKTKTE